MIKNKLITKVADFIILFLLTIVFVSLPGYTNASYSWDSSKFSNYEMEDSISPIISNVGSAAVGPYDTILTSAGDWGGNNSIETIFISQQYRIRQAGTIKAVSLYTESVTNLLTFKIRIWRFLSGTTYTLVGESENIASSLASGQTNYVVLPTPIGGVQPGDYYGYRLTSVDGTTVLLTSHTDRVNSIGYYDINRPEFSSSYDINTNPSFSYVVPMEMYMDPPTCVMIGDSITQGVPNNYAFTQTYSNTTNLSTYWGNIVAADLGWTYQNMGHGSDETGDMDSRFIEDVVNQHPKYVFIEGGINDILNGVSNSVIIGHWTSMLSKAHAAGIIPIIIPILPDNGTENFHMQSRDAINAAIMAMAPTYDAIVIGNTDENLGQFRVGGDANNLWNIKTGYNNDPYHFNTAGSAVLASTILASLNTLSPHRILDSKGYSNGTTIRNTSLMHTDGEIGSGLNFNGTTDYINTNSTFQSNFQNSFSISLWVKPSDGIPSSDNVILGTKKTSILNEIALTLKTDGSLIWKYISNGSDPVSVSSAPVFLDGSQADWHNIVANIEKISSTTISLSLYLDGSLLGIASGNASMGDYLSSSNLFIGAENIDGGVSNLYSGSLDDLTVFNRVITPAEASFMYWSLTDTTVPTTNIDLNGYTTNTWTNSTVTVDLTCNDNEGGSGCDKIYACQDTTEACNPTAGTAYTSSKQFTYTTDSITTVRWKSKDVAGNWQATEGTTTVKVDKSAPTTVADAGTFTFSGWTNDNVTITLSCADGSGSGCAATLYCTDSTNTCTPNTPYIGSFEVVASGGPRGIYVRYLSTDLTSNAETTSYKVINIIGPTGGGAVGGTYTPPETPVIPETPIIIPIINPPVETPSAQQILIIKLELQIASLQAQIAAILNASTSNANISSISTNFIFTKKLSFGMIDNDVKYLQILLNSNEDTQVSSSGIGSSGHETTRFGTATFNAVKKFQQKYSSEILTPQGFRNPTGIVGASTIKKLNSLLSILQK